jgi:hypothetical protein
MDIQTLRGETQFETDTITAVFLWERDVLKPEEALMRIRASLDIEKIGRAIHKGIAI